MTIFFHQTVEFLRFDLFQKLRIASQYIPDWNNNRNTWKITRLDHRTREGGNVAKIGQRRGFADLKTEETRGEHRYFRAFERDTAPRRPDRLHNTRKTTNRGWIFRGAVVQLSKAIPRQRLPLTFLAINPPVDAV